ncbi:uncharacterized protein MONBRDRAFT_30788 [Monosiga brevicollis MX1]|uniref:Glycoside hydrolase family 31 TIM barrel domain-containing protein n=1 Tax=Monosiga brevicollis TaxID=81824 RepID=A9UP93_MONBE|nr:uncharacterized protein MONBRDRAFT_30788 [Monosiga brevicollis MX1]EDQ92380.1 predicted protein [Monosiga brevicollis MX1]|eukprot:XP_001742142.1 hypothetical protein [Monosiga brevicollis MX1]
MVQVAGGARLRASSAAGPLCLALLLLVGPAVCQEMFCNNPAGVGLAASDTVVTLTGAPSDWVRMGIGSRDNPTPSFEAISNPFVIGKPSFPLAKECNEDRLSVSTGSTTLTVNLDTMNWTLSTADNVRLLSSNNLFQISDTSTVVYLGPSRGAIYGSRLPAYEESTSLTASAGLVRAATNSADLPSFWHSQGYSVFLITQSGSKGDSPNSLPLSWLVSPDSGLLSASAPALRFDIYLRAAADLDDHMRGLYRLIGPPVLPPLPAFGLLLTQSGEFSAGGSAFAVVRDMRSAGVPLDGFFANYQWYAAQSDSSVGLNGTNSPDFGFNAGYFVSNFSIDLDYFAQQHVFFGGQRWPRLINASDLAKARDLGCVAGDSRALVLDTGACQTQFHDWMQAYDGTGVSGFWNLGPDPSSNYTYSLLEAVQQRAALSSPALTLGLTSTFVPGLEQVGYATTGWDVPSTWDGLQRVVVMMLNLVTAGQPMVAPAMLGDDVNVDSTLLVRFYQASVFFPLMRVQLTVGDPTQWPLPQNSDGLLQAAVRLRYQWLPYMYSTYYAFTQGDHAPVRTIVTSCQGSTSCLFADTNQWFWGRVLVVPALSENGLATSYLPPSSPRWFVFNTTTTLATGSHPVSIQVDEVKLYVPPATIIFLGDDSISNVYATPTQELRVHVYAGGDASMEYVEPHRNGSTLHISFTWLEKYQILQWQLVNGTEALDSRYLLIRVMAFYDDLSAPIVSYLRTFVANGYVSFQEDHAKALAHGQHKAGRRVVHFQQLAPGTAQD